jgi:phytanoyl-CoA hydroxylase
MPGINSLNTSVFVEEPVTEKLFVNDGLLQPGQVGRLRPSDPNAPIEELRKRLEEDNYLFLKGLLPREDVLKAREAYFKFLSPTNVLKEGTQPVEGIFDLTKDPSGFPGIGAGETGGNGRPGGENAAAFVDLALQAHMEDFYAEDFCKHPALSEFVTNFSGWGENTLQFRRSLLRNNIPGTHAIGTHYDQIFLRHGEVTNLTAWCPMGDIKINGGGLIYLEKSKVTLALDFVWGLSLRSGKSLGQDIEAEFFRKAAESGFSDEEAKYAFNNNMMATGLLSDNSAEFAREHNRRWLASDFEAGDVVLHDPFAVSIQLG